MKCPDCGEIRHHGECADPLPDILDEAIFALQRVAMAHPGGDEHSREMYLTVSDIHLKLVRFKQRQFPNPQAASPIQGGNKMGEPLASKDARLKEEG